MVVWVLGGVVVSGQQGGGVCRHGAPLSTVGRPDSLPAASIPDIPVSDAALPLVGMAGVAASVS